MRFYTTSVAARDGAASAGYTYDGIACYAFSHPTGEHFYTTSCDSRHKLAAVAINRNFAGFSRRIFTLKFAFWQWLLRSTQTLRALEKPTKSIREICTFGHFMVYFCTFGHNMPFLAA